MPYLAHHHLLYIFGSLGRARFFLNIVSFLFTEKLGATVSVHSAVEGSGIPLKAPLQASHWPLLIQIQAEEEAPPHPQRAPTRIPLQVVKKLS